VYKMRRSGRKSSHRKTLDKTIRNVYNDVGQMFQFLSPFHAQPCMEGLFLTPVLTTSCDGKRVKIANLGIAKTMCDNSRLSNYKAYASAE
jgi:hypothetical protein